MNQFHNHFVIGLIVARHLCPGAKNCFMFHQETKGVRGSLKTLTFWKCSLFPSLLADAIMQKCTWFKNSGRWSRALYIKGLSNLMYFVIVFFNFIWYSVNNTLSTLTHASHTHTIFIPACTGCRQAQTCSSSTSLTWHCWMILEVQKVLYHLTPCAGVKILPYVFKINRCL